MIGQNIFKRIFFLLVKLEELKKKKTNKYLASCYISTIEYVSNEICNRFCSGCEIVNSPKFTHVCLLSKIDKVDIFGKEALGIVIKCGLISKAFYNKLVKKDLYTFDEIDKFIRDDQENPKKLKDVKKLFELERI